MKIEFDTKNPFPIAETRQCILDLLHKNECIVEFKKVHAAPDVELRVMACTLKADLMPPVPVKESTEPKVDKKVNPEVISVWCTDKQAFRSFRVANVISITIKE